MLILHSYWTPQFCNSSYMVIILYNLKILLSLLLLSQPTIQKFFQPANWIFVGLVIPLIFYYLFFLEIGRNYASIIITIISNTTVLVSTVLFALDILCLWAMVSIWRLLQRSPPPLPLTWFSPGLSVVL